MKYGGLEFKYYTNLIENYCSVDLESKFFNLAVALRQKCSFLEENVVFKQKFVEICNLSNFF